MIRKRYGGYFFTTNVVISLLAYPLILVAILYSSAGLLIMICLMLASYCLIMCRVRSSRYDHAFIDMRAYKTTSGIGRKVWRSEYLGSFILELKRIVRIREIDLLASGGSLIDEFMKKGFSIDQIRQIENRYLGHSADVYLGIGAHDYTQLIVPKGFAFELHDSRLITRIGNLKVRAIATNSSYMGSHDRIDQPGIPLPTFLIPFDPFSEPDPEIDRVIRDWANKAESKKRKRETKLELLLLQNKYLKMKLEGKRPILVDEADLKRSEAKKTLAKWITGFALFLFILLMILRMV